MMPIKREGRFGIFGQSLTSAMVPIGDDMTEDDCKGDHRGSDSVLELR